MSSKTSISKNMLRLKILKNFLIDYRLNLDDELCDLLSDMCIYTWAGGCPAVPSIWHDWEEHWKAHIIESEMDKQLAAQSFMAAFQFLYEVYWEKNNRVTLGVVINAIHKCLIDVSQNKENPLWDTWNQYLEAEERQRYRFAEKIILPIIVEREIEGLKHYHSIEQALLLMDLKDIENKMYKAFDAEGKTISISVVYKKSKVCFLLRLLFYIYNILCFLPTKKYYFEVFLSRTYQDEKEYIELALNKYLQGYGLYTANKNLLELIRLLRNYT